MIRYTLLSPQPSHVILAAIDPSDALTPHPASLYQLPSPVRFVPTTLRFFSTLYNTQMLPFPWQNYLTSAIDFSSTLSLFRTHGSLSPSSPFSNPLLLPVISFLYLATLHFLPRLSHHSLFRTSQFTLLVVFHNLFLSFLSLVMNLGALHAITTVSHLQGFSATLCTSPLQAMPPQIEFWLYLFYLSKLYELFDTAILVLRRRPLTLLHVWHHTSVMYEVYAWLRFGVALGIYGMLFNTAVHVFMYFYYAVALLKVRFRFKRAITVFQIVQFCTGFVSLIPFARLHFAGHGCRGVPGLIISAFINGSYLVLFIKFYGKAYRKKEQ